MEGPPLGALSPTRLEVLGSVRGMSNGELTSPPSRQVGRLVTVLAGWPTEPVLRDRIIEAMWGGSAPGTVINTLQVHVSHARRWLGRELVSHRNGAYILNLDPLTIDAYCFDDLLNSAAQHRRRGDAAVAVQLLSAAVALVRGTAFPDVYDPELLARRSRIAERADQAHEDLLECRLEAATDGVDLAEVIADARQAVSRHPRRESSYAILMRSLAVANRLADEAEAFGQISEELQTNGLNVSEGLKDLHDQCQQRDPVIIPEALRPA